VAGVFISRTLLKQQPRWRAVARIVFLALLTLLLLQDGIVPYQPLQITGTPYRDLIAGTLKIAWWLWAAWFFVALVRAVVILEGRPREGRLIQDILSALNCPLDPAITSARWGCSREPQPARRSQRLLPRSSMN